MMSHRGVTALCRGWVVLGTGGDHGGLVLAVARRICCLKVFRQRGIADIVVSRVPGDVEERGEFMGSWQ